FLGGGALAAPLPGLGRWAADAAPVQGGGVELKYQHFSVIQSASRRLPLVTAVNIDGERAFALKREGDWKLDGRLSADHQIGNELYVRNALDRGHMVRRRDPGWGDSREEAERGERDTFHYTNSAPQHEILNQRTWVGLEDYILQNAHTRGFRACVFTGPVFRDDDRRLKAQPGAQDVQIPEEFWKVAVMVNDDTGALSATGYVLSHGPLIRDLVEAAFVYGAYETYQVRIDRIERATGLDFAALRPFDPLARPEIRETLFGEAAFAVRGPGDIRL
ncbi:MAG: DNA/RNA non-specific endonuclease, partial [Rubrimonas sp.]